MGNFIYASKINRHKAPKCNSKRLDPLFLTYLKLPHEQFVKNWYIKSYQAESKFIPGTGPELVGKSSKNTCIIS